MAVTILEALQNARHNFQSAAFMPVMLPIANEQLNNAVVLLEKGYDIDTEVEPLLEEYGSVEDVPEKEQ
jgi:hypothetical protein